MVYDLIYPLYDNFAENAISRWEYALVYKVGDQLLLSH